MAINIKPSHKGLLHKNLGVKKGEKIPASKLKIKSTDSPAVKKRKQFAINAKKWHHQDGGEIKQIHPDTIKPDIPQPQARKQQIQQPHAMNWEFVGEEPKSINWGKAALDTLFAVDALIPKEKSRTPLVTPQPSYTQYPYGTGSQAIYEHGGELPCYDCGGEMQGGGKMSFDGYKSYSKDRNEPSLRIPGRHITMDDVGHPVLGIDDNGKSQMMYPGNDYTYTGKYVNEYPVKNPGALIGQYGDNKAHYGAENGGVFPFGTFTMPTAKQSVPKFQMGGYASYPAKPDVYRTQAEVDAANMEAKKQAIQQGLMIGENAWVAKKPGDPKVPYVYPNGMPTGVQQNNKFLKTYIPPSVGPSDVWFNQKTNTTQWINPDSGDVENSPGNYVHLPRFQQPKPSIPQNSVAKAFDDGGWIIPMGVESNLPYSKETMEYAHGGTMGENLHRDIYPSGRLKAQREVYNPLFQVGGIIPGLTGTIYSRGAYKSSEKVTDVMMAEDGSFIPYGNYMMEDGGYAKGGDWIKGAVNPKHKGYCTPMTKSTCTPRRKAFAMTMKKHHGFHKKGEDGLAMQKYYTEGEKYDLTPDEVQHLIRNNYDIQLV